LQEAIQVSTIEPACRSLHHQCFCLSEGLVQLHHLCAALDRRYRKQDCVIIFLLDRGVLWNGIDISQCIARIALKQRELVRHVTVATSNHVSKIRHGAVLLRLHDNWQSLFHVRGIVSNIVYMKKRR